MTINGTWLTSVTGVSFGGTPAQFTANSDSRITATVPPDTPSGYVSVSLTLPGGSQISSSDFLNTSLPSISNVSPNIVIAGTPVTMTGTDLKEVMSMAVAGISVPFTVVSDTEITFTTPAGLSNGGNNFITGTAYGGSACLGSWSLFYEPMPMISWVSPSAGAVGSTVTLHGSGFGYARQVVFAGGATAQAIASGYTGSDWTTVSATVPPGAQSGPLSLTVLGGYTASSTQSFTVIPLPAISSLSPASGPLGSTVTVTGSGLSYVTQVSMGQPATNVSFKASSDTQLSFTVPENAQSGPITVYSAGGSAMSATSFMVTGPTLNSFAPASAKWGDSVTLTGSDFSYVGSVSFNGVAASSFTIVSPTQITATVPYGATSGPVTVTDPAGSSTSTNDFTVLSNTTVSTGSEVLSLPGGVSVTFPSVSAAGFTNASESATDPSSGAPFQVLGQNFYDITSTASFGTPVTVAIPYDPTGLSLAQQQALELMQYDSTSDTWTNVTTSVDTNSDIIYGQVTGFCWFAIAGPVTTTTSLSSDEQPSTYGDTVDFTATVTPNGPSLSAVALGGTVDFYESTGGEDEGGDPTVLLGSVPLTNGSATFSTSALGAGDHQLSAVYEGDPSDLGSSSFDNQGYLDQTVDQATLTVNAEPVTVLYGTDTTAALPWNLSGFVNDEDANKAGVNGAPDLACSPGTNAGDYPITVQDTGTLGAANYTFVVGSGADFTISSAPLVISAASDSKTCDGTTNCNPGVKPAVSGLVGTDTVSNLSQSFASAKVLGTNNSTLQVNPGYTVNDGDGGKNYTVTTNTATGTISPALLVISAASDSKTYDGTTVSPNGKPTWSGLQGTDSVSGVTQAFVSPNAMGSGASTLKITGYTIIDGNGGKDYTVTTNTATGTIKPAALTISAVTDSKTYDGTTSSNKTPSASGLQGSDSVSSLAQAFSSTNVIGTGNSTLKVTAFTVKDGNGGANYTVTTNTTTGTISPVGLTVTANNQSKAFGKTLTFAGTEFTTSTLYATSDTVSSVTLTSSGTAASAAPGTYSIVPSAAVGTGLGNYTVNTQTVPSRSARRRPQSPSR